MDKRFIKVAIEALSEQVINDGGSMTITNGGKSVTVSEDSPLFNHLVFMGTICDCIARDDPDQLD